jgi:hypothetical protein
MAQIELQPEEYTGDLRSLLDEELLRLPDKYRAPLVLCYLEGKTHMEAAQVLGWPSGSMSKRLEQAREILRLRLTRRGVALSSVVLITSLGESARAALPPALVSSSVKAGVLAATGQALNGAVSAHVALLAEGVAKTMVAAKLKLWMLAVAGVGLVTAGALLAAIHSEPQKQEDPQEKAPRAEASVAVPADLALVPGEALGFLRISVSQLWDVPAMKELRARGGNTTAELLGRAEAGLGVPIGNVEKITVIVLAKDEHELPKVIFVIATTKPYARDKVLKALVPGGTEEQHDGKALITGKEGADQTVYLVSDQIFVAADKAAMAAYLDLKTGAAKTPAFEKAVKLASGRHHVVAWFHVPDPFAALAKQAPLPEELRFLRPLLDVESGSLMVDVANVARARLNLHLPNDDSAKEAAETARAGVVRLKELLANLPPQARSDAFAEAVLKLAGEALNDTQIVREQSSVVVTVQANATPIVSSVVPGIAKVRAAANRNMSINNVKQIVLAMHNYHDTYQRFPPAAISDANGTPLLSWRVAILPFIEGVDLYKQFHLDEPWDSEHNKKLLSKMPKVYAPINVEVKEPFTTFYKVFTGKSTPFEDPTGNKIADIVDGTSNTLMVVEGDGPVPWTKPEDLPFDPDKKLPKLGGQFDEGFVAGFCDGSVRFINHKISEKTLKALITRNGGEVINANELP